MFKSGSEETAGRIRAFYDRFGITRVGNTTGLDILGIPTVMVFRPNSRSSDVSQGKGISLAAAEVSGLMEAVESWHAEHIRLPLRHATFQEMAATANVVPLDALPRMSDGDVAPNAKILWCAGSELTTGREVWVPYETVTSDACQSSCVGKSIFPVTTNGLGAGNTKEQAILHGLYEVIERDAISLNRERCVMRPTHREIDVRTVVDGTARRLVDQIVRVGQIRLWDISSEIPIPVVRCEIAAPHPGIHYVPPAEGFGCHSRREIALRRAILEAAQSRLTHIAGAREDRPRNCYRPPIATNALKDNRESGTLDCRKLYHKCHSGRRAELVSVSRTLRQLGFGLPVVVDLRQAEFDIPVVRVIVPGLEGPTHEFEGSSRHLMAVNPRRVERARWVES
ncbi:YcaO-like family protein [Mesorhizobium sp. M1328]|uniref:YcaO-like family protein n=1 Tax=Mesorhizobium sp. M1328 TaxID=2957082 RepID=UPI00333DB436